VNVLSSEAILATFEKRVRELLTKPVAGAASTKPSALYPPNQPPDLLIYAGEIDPSIVKNLRSQLPPKSFLFCLHPVYAPDQTDGIERSVPTTDRTLLCSLHLQERFGDKVALLVSHLPGCQVRLITANGIKSRFSAEIEAIEKAISVAQENAAQERTRGLIRLRCAMCNLPEICRHSGTRLLPAPPDTAAVICGAGPSLAFQIERLRTLADRVLIVAVGHAAPTLFKAGVIPDAVVESDYYASCNWPDDLRLPGLLVAGTDVAPAVTKHFDHILWWQGNSFPFNKTLRLWNFDIINLRMNRTVSVSAIDFAVKLGCSRIALVGQDLCVADDGALHVDGGHVDEGDGLESVPGNEGRTVQATHDLNLLRRSIQEYLTMTASTGRPEIFNCTHGGAVIEGTTRLSLDDFGRSPANSSRRPTAIFESTEPQPCPATHIETLAAAIEDYALTAIRILNCCSRLRNLLVTRTTNTRRIREAQLILHELLRHEEDIRSAEIPGKWIHTILQHVDTVLRETPGLTGTDVDLSGQLSFLASRFRFAGDLSQDILDDLDRTQKQLHGTIPPTGSACPATPYRFESFRIQAMDFIRNGNSDLAAILENNRLVPAEDRFHVAWKNQIVPYVRIREADGQWKALSNLLSMSAAAERDVRQFVTSTGYDKRRHGAVIVAPGNWIGPMTFSKMNPEAELIVVEPWLDLFSAMIDRGCFLHFLPKKTLILAADSRIETWKELFKERIGVWRLRGLSPLFFISSHSAAIREAQDLLRTVQALTQPRNSAVAMVNDAKTNL
jgi:hypothetical protein